MTKPQFVVGHEAAAAITVPLPPGAQKGDLLVRLPEGLKVWDGEAWVPYFEACGECDDCGRGYTGDCRFV